jgi:excisionase family DNA binding protein
MDTIPIRDKQYVTPKVAARYLRISRTYIQLLIDVGRLQAEKIESRTLIDVEVLKAFDRSTIPAKYILTEYHARLSGE